MEAFWENADCVTVRNKQTVVKISNFLIDGFGLMVYGLFVLILNGYEY